MTPNLKQLLDAELARSSPQPGQPITFHLTLPSGVLQGRLVELDRIGCAVDSLRYQTDRLRTATAAQLKETGEQLSKRLTYLMEPIRIIEFDGQRKQVQLRSDPPTSEPEGASYYEVLVQPEEIELRRYHKPRRQPRTAQPAHLTRQMLQRLVEDLVAAGNLPRK